MAASEWLCHHIYIDSSKFSKDENYILEALLYTQTYREIWESYKVKHKDFYNLVHINLKEEDIIMELNIIRYLINDLIKSKAYTFSGIAYHTQLPEDMMMDLFMNHKIGQLLFFPRRLLELHILENPSIYQHIFKKLIWEHGISYS